MTLWRRRIVVFFLFLALAFYAFNLKQFVHVYHKTKRASHSRQTDAHSASSFQKSSCFVFILGSISGPSSSSGLLHSTIDAACVGSLNQAISHSIMAIGSNHPICVTILQMMTRFPDDTAASRKYACFVLQSIVRRFKLLSSIVSENHLNSAFINVSSDSRIWQSLPSCRHIASCQHYVLFVHVPLELAVLSTLPENSEAASVNLSIAASALELLRDSKSHASVWYLYSSFCLALLLLPSNTRLAHADLHRAAQNAAFAFPSPTVIFSQFSDCDRQLSFRGGFSIAANFQLSLHEQGGPDAFFLSSDDSCVLGNINVENTQQHNRKSLRHVVSVESVLSLFPYCRRDKNSCSRILAAYEVIKQNVSIFNFDPDFFFFNPINKFNLDATVAMSSYSSNRLVYCDDCEEVEEMDCFGVWFWNAHHPAGTSLFFLYFFLYFTDASGVEGDSFFCGGKPCMNICDPRSAYSKTCPKGMTFYPLGPQTSDDQAVWLQLRNSIISNNMIRNWAAGKKHRVLNEDGFLDFASLSANKYPTANTFFYGHHTKGVISKEASRQAGLVGVHMSKFGFWKVPGMRETRLWIVPDSDAALDVRHIILLPSAFESLSSHQQENSALVAAIHISAALNHTVVLPTFNCKYTAAYQLVSSKPWYDNIVSAIVFVLDLFSVSYAHTLGIQGFRFATSKLNEHTLHPSKQRCEFFFHYDYGSLIDARIKFKENSFLDKFDRTSFNATINLECKKIQEALLSVFDQKTQGNIIFGGDLTCLEQLSKMIPSISLSCIAH
jgi:hypothetical protein